jgi:hypothetical protein
MCEHEWEPRSPVVRVCIHCDCVENNYTASVHVTKMQAAALGFQRNHTGHLTAKYWTFPEEVFNGKH